MIVTPYKIILNGLPDYFAMSVRQSNTVEAYFYLLFSWLSSCDTLFFNSKREKKKQKLTIFVLIAQRDTLHVGRAGSSRLMASYKKRWVRFYTQASFYLSFKHIGSGNQTVSLMYKSYLATPYLQQFYLRFYKFLELNIDLKKVSLSGLLTPRALSIC